MTNHPATFDSQKKSLANKKNHDKTTPSTRRAPQRVSSSEDYHSSFSFLEERKKTLLILSFSATRPARPPKTPAPHPLRSSYPAQTQRVQGCATLSLSHEVNRRVSL